MNEESGMSVKEQHIAGARVRILVLAFALAMVTSVAILTRCASKKCAGAVGKMQADLHIIANKTQNAVGEEIHRGGRSPDEATAAVSEHIHAMTRRFYDSVRIRMEETRGAIAVVCTLVMGATLFLLCLGVWFALHNERIVADSERRYRELIENALVGVLVYQDGRIRFVNETLARWGGYSRSELVGRPILDFVHPEDRQMARERMEGRQRGEDVSSRYELRLLKKDGSALWIDLWVRSPQNGPGGAVTTNLVDITDRRMAQDELKKSEQKFRTFTEKSLHPIWVMQDDTIVYCNSAFGFYVGLEEAEDAVGRSVANFVQKQDLSTCFHN